MTTPEIITFIVITFIGLPAAMRNATAFALVLMWAAGQIVWMISGNSLPLKFYVMADMFVLSVILGKMIVRCRDKMYEGGWHRLRCIVMDLTLCDRAIAVIFIAAVWPVYVLDMSDITKYWALYLLTLAQFLLAGIEAFLSWRGAKRVSLIADPDLPSSGGSMRLAGVGDYG